MSSCMNIAQIEENVKALIAGLASGACTQEDFIYELLLAYGHRKQSVSRLRSGERNLAAKGSEFNHSEIIWKRHLYFKQVEGGELLAEIDQMRKEKLVATNKIRFVIVTDFDQLFAHDLKTNDRLDISLSELPNKFDFFLPWAGMEKAVYQGENPADVKAAEKMAKLFDLIKDDNFDESNKDDTEALHGLNVFLTRLLFCFFAEDTEIFKDNQFSNAIQSHTKDDGSDLSDYLNRLFLVLNTADSDRSQLPNAPLPEYLDNFPYVNGGLFADDIPSPTFSAKSRRMLIECGSQLDWSDINPDIFGSMIQAVVHPDQRGGMGMHYTSVTNIMKVIEPLFLNDLYEELEKSENSATKLQKLQQRLGVIKIFDPACGSGNFLIIAYKELRKLEMEVLKRLQEIELEKSGQISQPFSVIKLSQFYGIELDDFAHEVAILSLWLAEHQMNVEFKVEFGEALPTLPLKNGGNVISGNATRLNWEEVCENNGKVYILGNPPYLGFSQQSIEQKLEIKRVWGKAVKLDYISCWFFKAAEYIERNGGKFSFVSTNSISQGEQVSLLWPTILKENLEIFFSYNSFQWINNARDKAGVYCIIVGVQKTGAGDKKIFQDGFVRSVSEINPYLTFGPTVYIHKRSKPLSKIPPMTLGDMAKDGGHLFLNEAEKYELLTQNPETDKFIKKVAGSDEFIRGKERWCLWITEENFSESIKTEFIKKRLELVASSRLASAKKATQDYSKKPYRFVEIRSRNVPKILIPTVSSSRREYIPLGFFNADVIVNAPNNVIYDPEPFIFGVMHSKMHMAWVKAVGGRLKTDYRYSVSLVYNTFPIPELSEPQKQLISERVFKILEVRESYADSTIAKLYDPDHMPEDLFCAHAKLDSLIESFYCDKILLSDEQRLEVLMDLYKEMTGGQNA